jgi:hypothetical protein
MTRGTPPRRTPAGRGTPSRRSPAAPPDPKQKGRSFSFGLWKANGRFNWNRLVVYLLGVVLIIALAFPFWRGIAFPDPIEVAYAALTPEERAQVRTLPEAQQALLKEMVKTNAPKAADMLLALRTTPLQWNDPLPTTTARIFGTGTFTGVDALRQATGTATIYRVGDLTYLRLENFSVSNGPALRLYFSHQPIPSPEMDLSEAYDMGDLKGTAGNIVYPINFSLAGFQSIVIYDAKYHEYYAGAPITYQ